jgi:hypothetical protein
MKMNYFLTNAVFWDVTPCGFIINKRFGRTCHLYLQGGRNNASEEKSISNRLTDRALIPSNIIFLLLELISVRG